MTIKIESSTMKPLRNTFSHIKLRFGDIPATFSKIAATLALVATAIASSPIVAAETSSWIEEVVVTAQKREESAQDIPIAIDALRGEQLDALGIKDTDDLVKLYPNLSLQGNNSVNSGVTIRGVGTANWHITGQQAVGQYMDEVSLFSPYTSMLAVFDMERIEIMRGPQNTLFGRNTTGGAINYISRKPALNGEVEGFVLTNAGSEGLVDIEGAVTVPLGENVAIRIAGQTVQRDGIYDNLFNGKEMGDIDRRAARVQLAWAPSDDTEVLANIHVGYNDSGRKPYQAIGFWDPNGANVVGGVATAAALSGAPIDCPDLISGGSRQFDRSTSCVTVVPFTGNQVGIAGGGDWHKVYDAAPDKAEIDFEGWFVKVNHDFENVSLTSITAYDELSAEYNETLSGLPQGWGFMPGQSGESEVFSQELRLASKTDGGMRWILGSYYSSDDSKLATIIYRTDNGGAPFGIVPSIAIDQEVEIWSIYGQVEYDLSEQLTLTVGLRYTDDSKEGLSVARVAAKTDNGHPSGNPLGLSTYLDLDRFNEITAVPSGVCPPPVGGLPCRSEIPVEQNLEEYGGRISLDYTFNDSVMGYVSYSRGFKSGAFDTRALAAFQGTADQPTSPEFLDAYEVGFKSSLFEGSLELNGAMFYYEWTDLQAFDVDNLGRVAFLNIPESELTGLELEAKWAPSDSLFIQAGIGYLNTEVLDAGTLVTPVEGAPLSGSPEFTFTGLVVKSIPIGDNLLSLQTDFRWKDETQKDESGSSLTRVEDNFIINARVTYAFGDDDQYELAIWGENLTSEKVCLTIGDNATLNYQMQCNGNPGMAFYGANFRVAF